MTSTTPDTAIHGLLYVSSAIRLLEGHELSELLAVSRRNNDRDRLTGLLLYKTGNFMQYFEGPPASVEDLLSRLQQDTRHRDMTILHRAASARRAFPNWRMAFTDLSHQNDLEHWLRDYLATGTFETADLRFVRDYVRNFNRRNR